VRWLTRLADRTHPRALPGAWVGLNLLYFYLVYRAHGSASCCWTGAAQIWGSILNYVLITGYLLAAIVYLHRGHRDVVRQLAPLVDDQAAVTDALADPKSLAIGLALLAGALFGFSQYSGVLLTNLARVNPWLDLSIFAANEVTWLTVAFTAVCRVSDARSLGRLGRKVRVDLYDLARLRPFGSAAIRDVLVIMGALALMPLQALDAEFRLVNYRDGLIVGLTLSGLLFLIPQLGVRAAIRTAKAARLEKLQQAVDAADRRDVVQLESLVAHRDRIQHMSTWPLDLSLVGRVVFYLVIPPLAWVGAALVELMVDRLVG
jgi:hypothetical protein